MATLGVAVFFVISETPQPPSTYHGPDPNIFKVNVLPSPTPVSETPNNTSSSQISGNSTVGTPEYGIAAGGGLIFLSQSDLDKYFSGLQALGVTWVRWDVDWNVVQPNNSNNFNWSGVDSVVNMSQKYGIKSVGTITYTPKWARRQECISDYICAPADSKQFGKFAGVAAARYKDVISYWEIWNEPNYPLFWAPKPDIQSYENILKEAYIQIKAANPNALVLSGGLSASEDGQKGSFSPLTFLTVLYNTGYSQYFDAIALHPYTYPGAPDYKASWNHWLEMLKIRKLMISKGEDSKKIWVTEFGAATGGPGKAFDLNHLKDFRFGTDFMTEAAQSQMFTIVNNFYISNTDWMGPFFWYSFIDEGQSNVTPENFFGLLRYDWSEKPAYKNFKNTINSAK